MSSTPKVLLRYSDVPWSCALFGPKNLIATLDGFEIGATGPGTLQFVLRPKGYEVTAKLTADEARWVASALVHWADESGNITTYDA